MNYKSIYKVGVILLMGIFLLGACKKGIKYADAGDSGKTIVKIKDAENAINVIARDVNPAIETFGLIDIRRDANSQGSLNNSVTVNVVLDESIIDDYNTDNGTSFIPLPAAAYTLSEDLANLTFQPGEHAKLIKITLDKDKLDLSEQYALGISISAVNGDGTISNIYSEALYSIGLKNQYDGVYEVTGTMVDNASSSLTGYFPMNYYMITSGPNSVDGFDPDLWADYFIPIYSGTDVSGYGQFSPVFTFDPATNKIISVTNLYGQPSGNGRSAELDPSGVNAFDPATKRIQVKFFMIQPASIPAPPHIRVEFNWDMKYKGSR